MAPEQTIRCFTQAPRGANGARPRRQSNPPLCLFTFSTAAAVQAGVALKLGIHSRGDFGHALLRAGFVPIAARRSANAKPSYDLAAVLDRDTASNRYNIGQVKKRRVSTGRIFADCLRKSACPIETENRPIVTTV